MICRKPSEDLKLSFNIEANVIEIQIKIIIITLHGARCGANWTIGGPMVVPASRAALFESLLQSYRIVNMVVWGHFSGEVVKVVSRPRTDCGSIMTI